MARNYPVYTRLQSFYTEQYDNEMYNRLRTFYAKQRGGDSTHSAGSDPIGYRGQSSALPTINPGKFARDMVRKERETMEATIAEAKKQQSKEEMKAVHGKVKDTLYDGFSREGKGRAAYLKERKQIIPEDKYSFPVLSSWKYGWQQDSATLLHKPKYARSRKINDTFYTRNGIPDVYNERPYTSV